jgi:Mu transposase, C-terminal
VRHTVKKDNTFSFQSRRYETPADLRGQDIQLRHDRHNASPAVIIYHKGQRIGPARLLDPVANGLLRRKEQP